MTYKSEVDITARLYSIAEQLKSIGKEGLQHYVNEWNKLQHEKLIELGSRLFDILDSESTSGSSDSDISNRIKTITEELKTVTYAGKDNYLNPFVERRYKTTSGIYKELDKILEIKPLTISHDFRDISGFTTPMIGAEAALFRDGKLLLIQRANDGLWAVPGGGNDVGNTFSETAIKELEEETGLQGTVKRLLGIFDSRLWGSKLKNQIYHVIFEVDVEKGEPEKTIEALDCGFFGKDELPPLSPGHDMQVPFLFELIQDERKTPYFD